ncbi:hypothetical protein EST38_g8915 [Candolleomyces aberdarensis]|uniref:HNH nuclease domain-containing protein n=1 Tax=Candolleomyces aberdarensis TaxID=2316362 RepID=A0A4Q2DBA1_9AGAR|nr:hypothetical protein EST38_g8915 [Candolleomyces aberdarensis]
MVITLPVDSNIPEHHVALAHVADVERRLLAKISDTQEQGTETCDTFERHLAYCRVLGNLIHLAPNDSTRSSVALSIAACSDDTQLVELGASYVQDLLAPQEDEMDDAAQGLLKDHHTAKMKALFRDSSRCIATGHIDRSMAKNDITLQGEIKEEFLRNRCYIPESTRGVHILPESTGHPDDQTGTSKLWEILEGFGYESLCKENAGVGHHRLQNLLTMEPRVCDLFNGLKLWFEPMERENTYRIKCYHWAYINLEREVTFTTPDVKSYPLPSRESLEIHAACCKVMHESGVFTYIDAESNAEADCDDDEMSCRDEEEDAESDWSDDEDSKLESSD